MKLLLVTPHFYPETFKCNDMAFELARRGHDVTVMTAIPDYPEGHFHRGYGVLRRRRERVNGVSVHRSLLISRHNGTAPWLALNYLSYTFFAFFKALWFGLTRRYDAVIVHETSPVMVGIPAVIVKKMQRIPLHFWVLDLWPESLTAAGGITSPLVLKPFERLTRWIYDNSDTILIGSEGFRTPIVSKKQTYASRVRPFPNWLDPAVCETESAIRLPEGKFNVVFAGNLGDAQDIPAVLEAIRLLRDDPRVHFTFVGGGRKRQLAESFIREHRLSGCVTFIDRVPRTEIGSILRQASAQLLTLKESPIFRLTVPARLQAYMQAGRPVIAMINGEAARLIDDAQCGWSVAAGDSQALASLIAEKASATAAELDALGANGRAYATAHYDFSTCIDNLESILRS